MLKQQRAFQNINYYYIQKNLTLSFKKLSKTFSFLLFLGYSTLWFSLHIDWIMRERNT